jgi:glucose-6-phosphate 1-dehydrogenase
LDQKPTNIIILGVTGDLTAKKIMPALFNLWKKGALPEQFNIIGFGRKEMDSAAFKEYAKEILGKKVEFGNAEFGEFSKELNYVQGLFEEQDSYKKLGNYLDELEQGWTEPQRLFYLAVPPEIYATIFENMDKTKLAHGGSLKIATKVLVEKPFGHDEGTAKRLDKMLGSLFQEHQIYRIDHYLAKEMIQNILAFRFSNDIFEKIWNSQFIEKIEIKTWETLGVEQRGAFYDAVGTLRDVGQNHLLQMLALTAMDAPLDYSSQAIQLRRAQILDMLKTLTAEDVQQGTSRSQYEGFRQIAGVRPDSQTETYFKIKAELNHPRWQGVPIYLEAGKRIKEQIKDITVTFRRDESTVAPEGVRNTNRIIFTLEPEEAVQIEFWAKKPGYDNELEKRVMDFRLRTDGVQAQYVEEYEKLLLDAVRGDQTLFVSTAEVNAGWRFIDPIVKTWQENAVPLKIYEPDTFPERTEF